MAFGAPVEFECCVGMWFTVATRAAELETAQGTYPSGGVHASATKGKAVHHNRLMLEALMTK